MIIKQIELNQFRNYENQTMEIAPGINVFYGDNAQGKTNILEAVYLCACARSHRTSRDSELIRRDADQYRVWIRFVNQNGSEEEIEINYFDVVNGDPQRSKAMRIVRHNGIKLDKISDLMGIFHAVIFAPEDLMLVKEGPSTRRRYLDLLISQVRPSYFLSLQQYSRYLMQRNKLLKDLRDRRRNREMGGQNSLDESERLQLDVWNQALAEQAAKVIEQRLIYAGRISEKACEAQNKISSGKEKLYVKYKTISGIKPDMSKEQIFNVYYNKLKNMINEDLEKGITGTGPHRDDLELSLDGDGLKPFASQGQQRSAVLALKLAELSILCQDTGEAPVLLLDDVMSELDENRRNSLLENINDAQVFVTCTDAQQVVREIRRKQLFAEVPEPNLTNFTFFQVDHGNVRNMDSQACL